MHLKISTVVMIGSSKVSIVPVLKIDSLLEVIRGRNAILSWLWPNHTSFSSPCAAGTYLGQQAKWKLGVPSCFGAALLSVCVFSWLQFTMHSFIACFILIGTLVLSAFSWAKNSNGSVLLQTRLKQNLDLLCNVWICNKSSVSLKGVGMFFFPFFPICLLFKAVWEGKGVKRGNVRRGRKHTHTNKGRERVGSNSALRFLSPDENSRTSTGLGNCFLQFFLCQPSLPLLISHSLDHLGKVVPKSPRVALAPSEQRFGVPIVPLGLAFSDRKSLTLYPGGGASELAHLGISRGLVSSLTVATVVVRKHLKWLFYFWSFHELHLCLLWHPGPSEGEHICWNMVIEFQSPHGRIYSN